MGQKSVCVLAVLVVMMYVAPVLAPSPAPGPSGGGGGSRLNLDSFTRYLESWNEQNPAEYQHMLDLLSKGNDKSYKKPIIALRYSNNDSVNKNDQLGIRFQVNNPNPIDLRIPLYVDLEAKVPGSDHFEKVNQNSMVVQPFAYLEKDDANIFESSWPEISTLGQMERAGIPKLMPGVIKFRAVYNDGIIKTYSSDWKFSPPYFGELEINLTNHPPQINNISLSAPNQTRHQDLIEYRAFIDDSDDDMLNVTLHILYDNGVEFKNETQRVKPGDISFNSIDYGFFSESEAGKNFTYYYSFDDGLSRNWSANNTGPNIRRAPKLYVDKLNVTPESSSTYWWDWYTFSFRAKNLNPEAFDTVFTLFTKTENSDWKTIDHKIVKVGLEDQMIYFNKTVPFTAKDANSSFLYRIKFSEYAQTGKDFLVADGPRINSKILQYSMTDWILWANLLPMILFIIFGSLLIERYKKRGIEYQERSIINSNDKNNKKGNRSENGRINDLDDKISAIRGGNK